MNIRFDVSVRCVDEKSADRLRKVLLPDNRRFPRDQRFRTSLEGSSLIFSIRSPRVRPALSTLESILLDVNLFNEVSQSSV